MFLFATISLQHLQPKDLSSLKGPLLIIEVRPLTETGKSLYEAKPRKAYQCFSQR